MPSRLIHRPLVAVLASALTLFLATGAAADPRPAKTTMTTMTNPSQPSCLCTAPSPMHRVGHR